VGGVQMLKFSEYVHSRTREYAKETSWESISKKTMEVYR